MSSAMVLYVELLTDQQPAKRALIQAEDVKSPVTLHLSLPPHEWEDRVVDVFVWLLTNEPEIGSGDKAS